MPIPANKIELREAIVSRYGKLKAELADIPSDRAKKKELEGHAKNTRMSVCDLVAYLVGWGQLVIKWNTLKDAGKPVDFPDTGYKWNELGALATKFYKDHESQDLKGLLRLLDQTVEEVLSLIDNKTNKQLYNVKWYGEWSLGRMIQLNTSSPYDNATKRLRQWKKKTS